MEAYTSFAQVYDMFMDNVPYEKWSEYLAELFREYGIEDGLLLDLGCGTGKLTRLMQAKGYDMIGIDNSYEMLDIARGVGDEVPDNVSATGEESMNDMTDEPEYEDETQAENKILYLLQDMREFELYGTVRGIYSACDSMNYILEPDELRQVFSLVNNYLDPQGILLFDFNSSYKYRKLLGENTFAENREEGSFIWENYFDEEEGINEYDLTLYIKEEGERFARFQEVHYQRCYELAEIQQLIEDAGMEFVAAYDAYTREPVREDSERIFVVARERGK